MAEGTAGPLATLIAAAKYRIGGASISGAPAAPFWAQMHRADPGTAGGTAVANGGHRAKISNANTGQFTATGTAGQVTSSADTVFSSVTANETIVAISIWGGTAGDGSGGTLMHTGPAAGSYQIGDNFTFAAGQITDTYVITGP